MGRRRTTERNSPEARASAGPRRVAILMGLDVGCCRNLIRGIHAYALEKQGWILRNSPCDPKVIPLVRAWKPDGIIATVFDREAARALGRLQRPTVDTAFAISGLKFPLVDVDHAAVGRLAAEHLLSLGHSHFGFLGSKTACYSEAREASFAGCLAAAGYSLSSCHAEFLYEDLATSSWKRDEPRILQWIDQLPKPAAVFACNDIAGRGLIDICSQLALRVPEQVAILGADDDELESLLTIPPLSSVAIPAKRVGYEAAAVLDRMMAGQPVEPKLFLPPFRVIVRQSTDTRATDDPFIAAALSHIRANVSGELRVKAIADAVGVGRRELERRFRKALNCSVLDDIRGVRIQRVKELLAATDLAMPAIARRSGFSSAERLAVVFRQVAGMTPKAYRRRASARG